jgi:hypothetical protein
LTNSEKNFKNEPTGRGDPPHNTDNDMSIYAIYNSNGDRMYQYGQSTFATMTARLTLAKEKYPTAGMHLKRIAIN